MEPRDTISVAELRDVVLGWCRRVGFSARDAAVVADVIIDADVHGVHSHGVRLLSRLAPAIERGVVDARGRPELAIDRGVTGVVDGHHAFGPVVCTFAVDHVVERCARFGLAAVAVRNSSHWGQPAFYARRAAARGVVLWAVSNSASAMPLWGAARKSVGNNPTAFGVPRADGEPIVLDVSMQQAAWGKLGVYADAGEQLPEAWGYDEEGRPTTDPAAIRASGRIRPMGDHKGSGLAVVFEALTGGLAASLHSGEVTASMEAGGHELKSQLFVAFDPDAFGGRDGFERTVAAFAGAAGGLEPAPGFDRVRLPGEGAAAHRIRHEETGIPLIPAVREGIRLLGG